MRITTAHAASLAACDRLLALPDLPEDYRQQTCFNRAFAVERLAGAAPVPAPRGAGAGAGASARQRTRERASIAPRAVCSSSYTSHMCRPSGVAVCSTSQRLTSLPSSSRNWCS